MATSIKISQLPAKGANLEATDLLEVSEFNGTGYVSKSITGQEIIDSVPAPATAWGTITGTLSAQTDLNTALSGKVPTTRTLTINGTTQDLSADRTFTVSTGITIGTTAITSGTVGRVLFEGTGNVVQESANLFWDNTNGRLGIGTSSPAKKIDILGSGDVLTGIKTTSSTGAASHVVLNDINSSFEFGMWGSTRTGYGAINANNAYVFGAGEFAITSNSNIKFGAGPTPSERMRIVGGTGNVLINTTTDAGYKLDVNGTARVQGNLYFGTAGSYLLGDTNNIRLIDKNNTIILQAFPNGVSNSETYLRSASGNFSFLRLRDDYVSLEYAVPSVSATAQNPIQINRGYFGNVLATDKSVLYVKSTLNSNLSNATTLRGIYIDINDTTTYTGFTNTRAIEAPRGGAYFNTTSVNASAILQADSTTKGFLCPRMTTTQINAIASPAEGLQIYNTTISHMCFYQAGAWVRINHSPM